MTYIGCMLGPLVADGGDGLHIWMVVANILNKQSPIVDKGWSSSLMVERGDKSHRKKIYLVTC